MPGEVLHISSLAEPARVVSTVLQEKVKRRHYRVTNSMCMVESERVKEKSDSDDSPAGLKKGGTSSFNMFGTDSGAVFTR